MILPSDQEIPPMQPWKTISKRLLCQPNRFLKVELHELELPDGKRIADWPWLITPDYANVLARTKDERFLCFRQTKYAVEGVTLAPVGGFLEPGEEPLHAAQRELREETGYESPEWHALGCSVVDANRGAGFANLYLALDAEPACEFPLEALREAAGGEPEIERRIHQQPHLGGIEDFAGDGNWRFAGHERPRREGLVAVLGGEG